jgi:hypothetical protein
MLNYHKRFELQTSEMNDHIVQFFQCGKDLASGRKNCVRVLDTNTRKVVKGDWCTCRVSAAPWIAALVYGVSSTCYLLLRNMM